MPLKNREPAKRGYLAQVLMMPPLIYPFQYNPSQVTDTKRNDWRRRPANPTIGDNAKREGISAIAHTAGIATEVLGRVFSAAELKQFDREGDRTLNFKFVVDGRELRPDEPERLRNEEGDILGDLSILRSFVYPELAGFFDLLAAIGSASGPSPPPGPGAPTPEPDQPAEVTFSNMWFNHPPSVSLVLGGSTMEGFITELKITETLFNKELDPTRAEVEVTMIERIDSLSFVLDSVRRIGRSFYYTAWEDAGKALGLE